MSEQKPRNDSDAEAAPETAAEPGHASAADAHDDEPGTQASTTEPAAPVSPSAGAAAGAPPVDSRARGRRALGLAVFALLLALAALAGGAYLWNQLQHLQAVQQAAVTDARAALTRDVEAALQARAGETAELERRLDAQWSEQLSSQLGAVREAMQALQAEQESLRTAQRNLAASLGEQRDGWLAAEAEYLLRIASQRLHLARDPGTAQAALEVADARLRETGDPVYLPARQALARALQSLAGLDLPDLAGTALTLGSLAEGVEQLPLRESEFAMEAGDAPADSAAREPVDLTTAEGWRQLGQRLWADVRSLVTIRRDGADARPLLPPDQRYFIRQNLRLQFEQAQLALLRSEQTLYRQSLQTATDWLREYFAMDHAGAANMLQQAEQLVERPVTVELPDISEPLRVLQRIREQLQREAERSRQPGAGS